MFQRIQFNGGWSVRRYNGKTAALAVCVVCAAGSETLLADFVAYEGGVAAESSWQTDAGVTVLEDFQSYSPGTQIPELPALGIRFDPLAGGGYPFAYPFSGTATPHGNIHLGNFPNGINSVNRWDDIVVLVLPGREVTALGFWNGDGQRDTLVANVYDAADNSLGSVGAYRGNFAGFISDTPISYVVLDGNTGDGWNHLDGLQTNAVPEPASVSIILLGGLTLLGRRR